MSEKTTAPTSRDVALRVVKFVEDYYGDDCRAREVLEGLWLAMQLVGGPGEAAVVMRCCGVNFADK